MEMDTDFLSLQRSTDYPANTPTKVMTKQKQRYKSTTTIAIEKGTAAIDSGLRIDPRGSVPAPARPQEEGAHRNSCNGVD